MGDTPGTLACDDAFYKLTVAQRNQAWAEVEALRERVKELEAALSEAQQWRPMETAPRDELAEMQNAKLPCDVLVAPATIIHAGVPLSTLLTAIARRAGQEPIPFTHLKRLATSTNYWANDDQKPTEVTFANGRVVRIVDGALEVSFAALEPTVDKGKA